MVETMVVEKFAHDLQAIYGSTLEIAMALSSAKTQLQTLSLGGNTTMRNRMYFGRGNPNDPGASHQHSKSLAELQVDLDPEGKNARYIRNMAVVTACAAWEVVGRKAIASEARVDTNAIEHEIMADLTKIRQAIVHAGGKLDRKLARLTIFNKGDVVQFSSDQFYNFFKKLFEALDEISVKYFDRPLEFSFDEHFSS